MKDDNIFVSIIIPIYNSEKYIEKCVESVVRQSYKNIEIILVNDGSKDRSEEIINHYKDIDGRIIVVKKKNGGLSDARNAGIKVARGKYLFFLDADDYIDDDCIEDLVVLAEKFKCEIAISDGIYEKNGEEQVYANEALGGENKRLSSEEVFKVFLQHRGFVGSPWTAWGKLYLKELFNGIEYPVGRLSEDLATTPKLILKANNIAYSCKKTYHYIIREGSLIHQKSIQMINDNYSYLKDLKELVNREYPELVFDMNVEYAWVAMLIGLTPQCDKKNILKVIREDVKKHRMYFMKSGRKLKYKIIMCAFTYNPNFVKCLLEKKNG